MKSILLPIFLLLSLSLFAQTYDQKFGKISMAEMEMKICPIDSSAEAVVLFDIGETRMVYNETIQDFQLEYTRQFRIKILSEKGINSGNFEISFYRNKINQPNASRFKGLGLALPEGVHPGNAQEKLSIFKGLTYNLVNGKIEKYKIEKENILTENKDINYIVQKISFPKVEKGSVVECKYSIVSDFMFNMQPWTFQKSIPVLLSRYDTYLFDYYKYNIHISGCEPVREENSTPLNKYFTFAWLESEQLGNRRLGYIRYNYFENKKSYIAKNIPALKINSLVDNVNNYATKIDFEFQYLLIPRLIHEDNYSSWESLNKRLLENDDFGNQLNDGEYKMTDLSKVIEGVDKPEDKIARIRSFIFNRIRWNGKYGIFTDKGVKLAYSEGSGNVAEINLNLVIAFKQAGLNAVPIILSTRSHGGVFEWNKNLDRFNYVIAGVKIDDKIFFSDAANLRQEFLGILPLECLNGLAFIVDAKQSDQINLYPEFVSKKSSFATFSIDKKLTIAGKVSTTYKDYYATQLMESINGNDGLKLKKEEIGNLFKNSNVDSLNVEFDKNNLPEAKESYSVLINATSISPDETISITPAQWLGFKISSFEKNDRKYPVNFIFPREESFVIKITLPDGYKVDELPSSVNYSLPEGTGKYIYNCQVVGNELVLISKLVIPKVEYSSNEYPALKIFVDEIIKKQCEKIVLKKI
ncbi:MAG: hypothetical protein HXX16_19675 [Bacteroidales bacterium]|nr:hypothetical protein [Bacteroidales bacterium]